MMKQEYKKPNMVVVELKCQSHVLTSSPNPLFDPNAETEDMD